ncbi:hypothetical protein ACEPAI_7827 [Sanghuangporus weigelae]
MSRAYDANAKSNPDNDDIELGHISSCGSDVQSHPVEVAGERSHSDASLPSHIRGLQPSETVFENSKPTRRYQTIFLVCTFLMIFQVMGLNSIYGVSQVSNRDLNDIRNLKCTWARCDEESQTHRTLRSICYVRQFCPCQFQHEALAPLSDTSSTVRTWYDAPLLPDHGICAAFLLFDRNRGLAMGIILSDNAIGGLILAPIIHAFIQRQEDEEARRD